MNAILTVTKTDTLLQGMHGCNQSDKTNRLPLTKSNALKIECPFKRITLHERRMLKLNLQKKPVRSKK